MCENVVRRCTKLLGWLKIIFSRNQNRKICSIHSYGTRGLERKRAKEWEWDDREKKILTLKFFMFANSTCLSRSNWFFIKGNSYFMTYGFFFYLVFFTKSRKVLVFLSASKVENNCESSSKSLNFLARSSYNLIY